ncbi:MAG: hypothetical protein IJ806_10820 [Ruminococcus sp.]|nr:hypothetical protein [Ruminococcus sp.]
MTDKQLRKLKRAELIEILYYLRKENEDLSEENKALKGRIDELTDAAFGIVKPAGDSGGDAEKADETGVQPEDSGQ